MKCDEYQVGGDHYLSDIQPWDAMRAWDRPWGGQYEGFLRFCALKYIARFGSKGAPGEERKVAVEDMKKAVHYLSKLIEEMETNP